MSGGLRPTQLMVRPRSVRWGFQLREWTVYLHYDHTARGVKPGGPKESSLLLSSWQRHAHGAVEADFQGYFTIGEANAPDYLLRVEGARGASFCFGDAKASDHRQDGAVASLAKQADDMSRKYSAKLGHRGQTGRIIHCVRSASFVLVPGDGYRWRDVQPDTDIVVMEALPGGAGGGPGSTHSVLPRVIETLIWHASGGRVEDLSRSEPAGAVVDVPKQGPPSPLLR